MNYTSLGLQESKNSRPKESNGEQLLNANMTKSEEMKMD